MIEKLPQAGEWWQHGEFGRVYVCGFDPDGDPVYLFDARCDPGNDFMRDFCAEAVHLPDCTGWDWQEPEPEPAPVKRVLLDLWTHADIVDIPANGWELFVTARDTCPSPLSRFIRVQYDDVAGFFIEVPDPEPAGDTATDHFDIING